MTHLFLAGAIGAIAGAVFATWMQDFHWAWIGAGLGALLGLVAVKLEDLFDFLIGQCARLTSRTFLLQFMGGITGALFGAGLSLLFVGSIGWLGNCWG